MDIISLTPKLPVREAAAALTYYAGALGAEVTQRYEHDGAVVFAELRRGALALQVKDGDEADPAPEPGRRSGVIVDLCTDDPDALAAAMVAAGGEVVFPVADQPYGVRQGRIRDPFGHEWIIGSPNTMSPEQIQSVLGDEGYRGSCPPVNVLRPEPLLDRALLESVTVRHLRFWCHGTKSAGRERSLQAGDG